MQSETNKAQEAAWNPELYDQKHAFVWERAADLVALLAPVAGERILDVGCGTGHLTATIGGCGARTVGVDASREMVDAARKAYPGIAFEVHDARALPFDNEFDAVFSNATLHWILEPELAISGIWKALRPGGRFVAELGGKGNIRRMAHAFETARDELSPQPRKTAGPWYYPSVSEYAGLLDREGFEVRLITLFDRPTPLADGAAGMKNWMAMFAQHFYSELPAADRERFVARVEELLRPELFRGGQWFADYRRLRLVAWK